MPIRADRTRSSAAGAVRRSDDTAASGYEMDEKGNHRENENQMNRPARHVKGHEAENPRDQENHSE